MCEPKPLSSVATIIRPPLRKMTGADLQLLGDLRGALTRAQPPYRRELDLPVENSSFCCGHLPFLGTVFPVFLSHFLGALQIQNELNQSQGDKNELNQTQSAADVVKPEI